MTHRIRVLHLEDDPRDAELARTTLEAGGLACDLVLVGGRAGYESALAQGSFDLILCDYKLPDYDALSAVPLAREKQPGTPLIVLSGSLGEEAAVECLKLGATDFVLKQRLERLVPAVRRALQEAEDRSRRERAEESLRAEEGFKAAVIQNAAEGLCVCHEIQDPPYVAFTLWNQEMTEITGYTMEEINRLGWYQTVYPDPELRARAAERMRRMREGDDLRREEWEITRADGTERLLSMSTSVLPCHDGARHVLAAMEDVTERRRAEVALRESKARLEEAQRIAHIGSWEHDLAADRFRYSDEMYRLLGVEPEDFPGTMAAFMAFVHPDDRPAMVAFVESVLGGRRGGEVDFRVARSDGTVRRMLGRAEAFFDSSGKPWRVAGSLQDVTEARLAEDSLRCQERRFRALVENSTDITALLDPGGGVSYVTPAFEQVLGRPAEAWLGRSVFDLIWPEDLAPAKAVLERVLQSPAQAIPWQLRVRHAEGSWRWLEGTAANLIAESAVEGIVVNCHDITERKRAEERQAKSDEMLFQSQKLEAIGRLAGGVAHDFNNILGVITGYGELMRRQVGEEHPARSRLEQVLQAAERATGLTRQLLAFSRKQVLQSKLLDLNQVVRDLGKMLERVVGEDVELEMRAAPDLGAVRADPTQLEQVILNMVVNARDAMPEGGHLTIETANADFDDAYAASHPPATAGRFVLLAVSDTGVGMDAETQQHVFEPFFTTKAAGRGTGLGLATVYGIVKQSGGYVWVYSEPGRGTTFKVYLPRVDAEAGVEEAALAPAAAAGGNETVLLVEDTEALREVVREGLEERGYHVLVAGNGEEALALAKALEGEIHLLLSDVVMPRMGGPELARRLSELRPGVRVLFMSGYSNGAVARQGVIDPGVTLVEKPFTGEALARAVRQALDGAIQGKG